jgi:acyl-CoA synthetase (AMP-forming)/AMP-acid ligase II
MADFDRLFDVLTHWAETQPDVDAYRYAGDSCTYPGLKDQVRACAKAMLASGVQRGDRVAVLSTPRPEHWISFLAAASIGAVWVGLNPRYRLRELLHVVEDSKPCLIVGLSEFEGRDYRDDLAVMCSTAGLSGCVQLDPAGAGWEAFLLAGEQVLDEHLDREVEATDGRQPSLLVYTSGTTGSPKGALLAQAGLCARFGVTASHVWPRPVRMVSNLPINHVGGIGEHGCMPFMAGGTVVFQERFDPSSYLQAVEEHKLTVCLQVPMMFKLLSEHPGFTTVDWSSVELVMWGGGAMTQDVIRRYRALGLNLKGMYGITETATALTFTKDHADDEVLANTTGIPVPEYSVQVRRPDGSEAAENETGEVVVDNRNVWVGYLGNPEATAEARTSDDLYRTGDLGFIRADGYLSLVGRSKEMFKSGGYNIYPREVELVIEAHPRVRAAVVVGLADEHYGEVGKAFVEMSPGEEVDQDELLEWCRQAMANYKVPKCIEFLDGFPLLPNGKIDRKDLRDRGRP